MKCVCCVCVVYLEVEGSNIYMMNWQSAVMEYKSPVLERDNGSVAESGSCYHLTFVSHREQRSAPAVIQGADC